MPRPAEPTAPLSRFIEPVTCGHPDAPRHGTVCTACYFRERRRVQAERRAWERARIARRIAELAAGA